MKLKEFIGNLNKLIEEDNSILDMDVIFSIDDEGNDFKRIFFDPSVGYYDEDEKEFYIEGTEDYEGIENYPDEYKINAVCIN